MIWIWIYVWSFMGSFNHGIIHSWDHGIIQRGQWHTNHLRLKWSADNSLMHLVQEKEKKAKKNGEMWPEFKWIALANSNWSKVNAMCQERGPKRIRTMNRQAAAAALCLTAASHSCTLFDDHKKIFSYVVCCWYCRTLCNNKCNNDSSRDSRSLRMQYAAKWQICASSLSPFTIAMITVFSIHRQLH